MGCQSVKGLGARGLNSRYWTEFLGDGWEGRREWEPLFWRVGKVVGEME